MRILYNSYLKCFKDPFGTLTPGEKCTIHIHIPASCRTKNVWCQMYQDNGREAFAVPMTLERRDGPYEIFSGVFSFAKTGLYFYYFRIQTENEIFNLFRKDLEDTNMEAGDRWQVSCVPADFTTPEWAAGAVIYQVFPDRFAKIGTCDLTGKLQPYTVHKKWNEEVHWQPEPDGQVLNNDFFGGNFRGITDKMSYLATLGVKILYLNPISYAFSSHRYDTADYKRPDPMLGTCEDFAQMCKEAHAQGIKVILDGVYSHTGSNSVYFDKNGIFGGGAYSDPNSPYRDWYQFHNYPYHYNSWWNFDTLPCVNKMNPSYLRYIIDDEDSVVAHWLKLGADGFRLDVADELPDGFLLRLKRRIREIKPDALLLGEVWEDASNKEAYGVRRRYFVDGELDSVMNYPFRQAIINFIRDRDHGAALKDTVMRIVENYPPQVVACNMNLLGTHDTPRILTALVDDFDGSREEKAARKLSPRQLQTAKQRLLLASFLQYCLPGSPSVYYGDEAGMEGYKDPFNRRTYPWGREDDALVEHFIRLGKLKNDNPALRLGSIEFFAARDQRVGFMRRYKDQNLAIYVNRSDDTWEVAPGKVILGYNLETVAPTALAIAPMGFACVEV